MRWGAVIAMLGMLCGGCGGDDGDMDVSDASVGIDSSSGADGSTPGTADGAPGGTQGPNQFCELLQDGGPFCIDGLDCCGDKVCREPDDCPGSTGFLPCDERSDCPSSKICCEIPTMTFCTKPSACADYDGTQLP